MSSKPAFLLYLHGFNSSPASYKAQCFGDYLSQRGLRDQLLVPRLNYQPAEALRSLQGVIEQRRANVDITLIGSSLGGYYATSLAEQYGLRAVLINPAVYPYQLLQDYLGINTNLYSHEVYEMTPLHVQQLRDMEVTVLSHPQRYRVYLQTADETLDYRQAADKYRQCQLFIEQGGSHGFDDFERVIADILRFAGITI